MFVAVVTFCIGVIAAAFRSAEPPPAPNLFEPPIVARAEDESCRWVSYDQWRELTLIRDELRRIEESLASAASDKEKIGLLERAIKLRSRLLVLMKGGNVDTELQRSGPARLVIRQVCDEN